MNMLKEMKLLSIQRLVTSEGRRSKFIVELTFSSEEDRKSVIAQIEDRQLQSQIEFYQWSREWKTFYNEAQKEFRMMQVLELILIAPFDMDPTGIGCFILDIIK